MDLRMVADEGEYLAQARAERNPTTYHPITRSPDHPITLSPYRPITL